MLMVAPLPTVNLPFGFTTNSFEVTLLNVTSLSVAKVKFAPSRFTRKFLPAFRVNLSPAPMAWPSASSASLVFALSAISPPLLSALANHFALLIALATLLTVATLFSSLGFA